MVLFRKAFDSFLRQSIVIKRVPSGQIIKWKGVHGALISDLLNSYANNFTLPRYKVYFYGTYETATLKSEGTFLTYLFTCTKILQGHLWTTGNNI